MNFYKHHLGDYDGATAHLDWAEDLAYRRLMGVYYRTETPIPADLTAACRLVRASNPAQKKAVQTVLNEFFELRDDGWHNDRCDEEVSAYQSQAATNRRIAQSRSGKRIDNEPSHDSSNDSSNDSSHEPSTKGTPNHEPLTKNHEPVSQKRIPRDKRAPRTQKTAIPPDFDLSERVKEWAEKEGHTAQLLPRFEHFIGKAKAKGYTYADWDEAFMGAVRDDWAGFNGKGNARAGESMIERNLRNVSDIDGGRPT